MNQTEFNSSFVFIQHTSTIDAQVCVKNYNSDANNKDVITVDYMVTGGKQKDCILRAKNHSVYLIFPFLYPISPSMMLFITIIFVRAGKAVEAGKSVETYCCGDSVFLFVSFSLFRLLTYFATFCMIFLLASYLHFVRYICVILSCSVVLVYRSCSVGPLNPISSIW